MPISVTCQCGARLEIDEKFLGKDIPCPDCQRPLPTKAPVTPPPLDLPDNRRVSGLAVLSLTLALVGAFTLVGTLAAIAVGVYSLRQIARQPNKLEGVFYARLGVILGSVFTFVTLAALLSPTVFGLDQYLRMLALVHRIEYKAGKTIEINTQTETISIDRPSDGWASCAAISNKNQTFESDDVILVNVAEDAFIACQHVFLDLNDKLEDRQRKALDRFYKSELVNLLGRLGKKSLDREGTIVDTKEIVVAGEKGQEITLDLRLGGIDRRFLIRAIKDPTTKLNILVGAARRNRFERLQDGFRESFNTFKSK